VDFDKILSGLNLVVVGPLLIKSDAGYKKTAFQRKAVVK
jgi:hypothetical protein